MSLKLLLRHNFKFWFDILKLIIHNQSLLCRSLDICGKSWFELLTRGKLIPNWVSERCMSSSPPPPPLPPPPASQHSEIGDLQPRLERNVQKCATSGTTTTTRPYLNQPQPRSWPSKVGGGSIPSWCWTLSSYFQNDTAQPQRPFPVSLLHQLGRGDTVVASSAAKCLMRALHSRYPDECEVLHLLTMIKCGSGVKHNIVIDYLGHDISGHFWRAIDVY